MASGRVHDITTLVAGASLVGGGVIAGLSVDAMVIAGTAFVIAGCYLSPDLDLRQSRPSKRWGFLSFLWWPYRRLGHRDYLTHGWLVGSLLRLLYLAIITSPIWLWTIWRFGMPSQSIVTCIGWSIAGAIGGGELHLLVDFITTGDNDNRH